MYVAAHYITQIGALLQEKGTNPVTWLERCGASPALLYDESLWLPEQQYVLLVQEAIVQSTEPDIGLELGKRLGIGSHGLLGYGLLNCTDLAQAAVLLDKYLVTRTPFVQTQIRQTEQACQIEIYSRFSNAQVHRAICETVTVTLANLFTLLAGHSNMATIISAIQFDFAEPDYKERYAGYFTVPVTFAQRCCAIKLHLSQLHQHFFHADETALKRLIEQFEQQLKQVTGEGNITISRKVEALIMQESQHLPTLQEVAFSLSMTPRTLHRKLVKEGTQFRTLLLQKQRAQAEKYLKSSNMPVEQVAWALGYNEVANFRRAFKRWCGMTPSEYRRRHKQNN